MLAGSIVQRRNAKGAAVSAYVVLSAGHVSRIFKVEGTLAKAAVSELEAATTVDIKRFQRDLEVDLEAALEEERMHGAPVHVERAPEAEVYALVRNHLKSTEGLDVG